MYMHPSSISDDVDVQAELYRKVPCNFAGMDEGCWYHKQLLDASQWVPPKFRVEIEPMSEEGTEHGELEPEDEGTHILGWFRREWIVIPKDMVAEDEPTQTQQWITELEDDIRGYIDGRTSCMAVADR